MFLPYKQQALKKITWTIKPWAVCLKIAWHILQPNMSCSLSFFQIYTQNFKQLFILKNSQKQHTCKISRLLVSAELTSHHQTFLYQELSSENYPCTSPICKDKFHRTALDKERSEDGLLTETKLVTWKYYIYVM